MNLDILKIYNYGKKSITEIIQKNKKILVTGSTGFNDLGSVFLAI